MIRPFTCLCLLMAGGSGLYLYQSKHRAQMLDKEIEAVLRQSDQVRARSGVLKAEWTLLNDPERLGQLAGKFLTLHATAPGQFTTMADLDNRLPAVRPPDAPPPPPSDEDTSVPEAAKLDLPRPEAPKAESPKPEPPKPEPPKVIAAAQPAPKPPPPKPVAAAKPPPVQVATVSALVRPLAPLPTLTGGPKPIPISSAAPEPAPPPVAVVGSSLGMARTPTQAAWHTP